MAEKTVDGRGFEGYADFTDSYGGRVRVKESSNAKSPHVWIFSTGGGVSTNDGAAHLNVEQARQVRDALTQWLDEIPTRWRDGEKFL